MEKYIKIPSKMQKHLVQQIVQQKVRRNYVALSIKRFVFTKLVE